MSFVVLRRIVDRKLTRRGCREQKADYTLPPAERRSPSAAQTLNAFQHNPLDALGANGRSQSRCRARGEAFRRATWCSWWAVLVRGRPRLQFRSRCTRLDRAARSCSCSRSPRPLRASSNTYARCSRAPTCPICGKTRRPNLLAEEEGCRATELKARLLNRERSLPAYSERRASCSATDTYNTLASKLRCQPIWAQ